MPVCFCEIILVTNTEIVSYQQSLELALAVLWWPSVIFHAKRDADEPFNSGKWLIVVCAGQIIEGDHSIG